MREGTIKMKSDMAFELKDGTILWIDADACEQIRHKVFIHEMLSSGNTFIMNQVNDGNLARAQRIYDIVKEQREMSPETKDSYMKAILEILKVAGEPVETLIGSRKPGEDTKYANGEKVSTK